MSQDSLFSRDSHAEPLAARMRPRFLDEFAGQDHIIGQGRLLRRAIQADMLSSLIFYGPPGTGKTTLARVIANTTKSDFISLNAVLAGVKDVRAAIEQAKQNLDLYDKRTILFVDEVHRWNKAQQDALLPWVENGTVVLIGATTHNPFFEVNSALVSRSRIFQLKPLTSDDLRAIARGAIDDPVRGYGTLNVKIDTDALEHLIAVADGDARGLLGALQLAVETSVDPFPPEAGTEIVIDRSVAEDSIQQKAVLYDKEGDYHFDVISAFIKSIRGSDPDATLYWMAKMVHSGEDPRFIFRRMLISASEDVGLADPAALGIVESAATAFERVGMPEGRFFLAEAALYLATCKKSNSALGFFDALASIEKEAAEEVPNHLRDDNRDKEGFGHGEGYLYPHAYRDHWVAQTYLPESLRGRLFYDPSNQGYEASIRERVLRLRELQLELGIDESHDETLTFSASTDRDLARWLARTDSGGRGVLSDIRDMIEERMGVARHHRVLTAGTHNSLALWSALRAAPEGLVVALFTDRPRVEAARHHAERIDELVRPVIAGPEVGLNDLVAECAGGGDSNLGLSGVRFDRILLVDPGRLIDDWGAAFDDFAGIAAPGSQTVLVQRIPRESQRLAELVSLDPELSEVLALAEESLYDNSPSPLNLTSAEIRSSVEDSAWRWESFELCSLEETRTVGASDLDQWFDESNTTGLGAAIEKSGGSQARTDIESQLTRELSGRQLRWKVAMIVAIAVLRTDESQNPGQDPQ